MIHVRVIRNEGEPIQGLHVSVTDDSLHNFVCLINRALNCWDNAPKELKDLGDMITHGRITQDHTKINIASKSSNDYYNEAEQDLIQEFIEAKGLEAWKELILTGQTNKVLRPTNPSTPT